MRFIKKPIEVEAWLIIQEELEAIFEQHKKYNPSVTAFASDLHGSRAYFTRSVIYGKEGKRHGETSAHIETLEGKMTLRGGDYLIRGIKGEFYPCKPDIFEATYEAV